MALTTADYFNSLPLGLKQTMLPAPETLDILLQTASDMVEAYCKRKFALTSYTTQRWGSNSFRFMLDQYPVQSITSVSYTDKAGLTATIDPTLLRFDADTGIVEWVDEYYDMGNWIGSTVVLNGIFMRDRLYTFTYQAGFSPVPGAVQHAVALQATELLQPQFQTPEKNVALIVPMSSALIVQLLEPYVKRSPAIR